MSKSAGQAPPAALGTPELSGPFGVGELQLGAWIAAFGRMSDAHPDMARILRVIERLQDRPFRAHIVIHGEPGTGKEGLARLLHRLMHPHGAPYVRANLTGCTSDEMLKQLFGRQTYKGSGGEVRSVGDDGLLAQADSGALLLDELLVLPQDVQRSLYEHLSQHRLGTSSGVALIAMTDGDLPQAISDGRFRHDLAYRLLRIVIHVPPLRERPQDIAQSTLWICNRILRSHHDARPAELHDPESSEPATAAFFVEEAVMSVLRQHSWPGNFRELEAVLERAVMLYSDGEHLRRTDVEAALGDGWPAVQLDKP
ncbi:MAG: sigma 54-interacting transcriptional regulator [Myxococcales bacterium]|nr:sigma 54-interacting transcriptional regulator [Myxococcales bacterium]